jgi:hypothetical protein
MKWVVDLSVWQAFTPQTLQTFKQHGLAGGIIRCAQGANIIDSKLESNVKLFQDAGIPYGVYQWVDITQDPIKQANLGLYLCDKYNARFLAGDFEQYWENWQTYWDFVYNHTGSISVAPSKKIYDVYASYTSLVTPKLGNKPFVAYSAPWFISYCPQLPTLLKTIKWYWNAYYPTYKDPDGDNNLSWEEFLEYFNNLPKEVTIPGIKTSIWQYNYMTIESSFSVDQNIVYDDNVFKELFGDYTVPIPPVIVPPTILGVYRVTALIGLKVRSSPEALPNNLNKIRTLLFNSQVNVYKIVNNWAKISPDKEEYCSMDYLKSIQ